MLTAAYSDQSADQRAFVLSGLLELAEFSPQYWLPRGATFLPITRRKG